MTADLGARLGAHAAACYPEECVGALARDAHGAVSAVPLHNASPRPREAFAVSARDYLDAEAAAARVGGHLVGFYHSHPDAPAMPSARDAASAWRGWLTVIVPVARGVAGPPRIFTFVEARAAFDEVTASCRPSPQSDTRMV